VDGVCSTSCARAGKGKKATLAKGGAQGAISGISSLVSRSCFLCVCLYAAAVSVTVPLTNESLFACYFV
jgi:hypothetical protein